MLPSHLLLAVGTLLASPSYAAPANGPLGSLIPDVSGVIQSIRSAGNLDQIHSKLNNLRPQSKPSSVDEAVARLREIHSDAKPKGLLETAAAYIKDGLISGDSLQNTLAGFTVENSAFNLNVPALANIFPKKGRKDAFYVQSQEEMQRQIYIPPTFTYGQKPPVILVPGTGARGGNTFSGNMIPLLTGQQWADPVIINPPGFMLADVQTNAETVAYAINYVSAISKHKHVSLLGWSQASIAMQWAVKYWPSARNMVDDIVVFSGDYKGTLIGNLIDPGLNVPLPPGIGQQTTFSKFISTLRGKGGASAYVPTTTVYSGFFDEIVEPQQDATASSIINDLRHVGVSNNQIQRTCPKGSPGAGFYTHEGVMASSLAFALVKDALTHKGPANLKRINLKEVCSTYLAPGLNLQDFLTTESTIPIAGLSILLYPGKMFGEPAIRSFAR